jgi:hypothetical protein
MVEAGPGGALRPVLLEVNCSPSLGIIWHKDTIRPADCPYAR